MTRRLEPLVVCGLLIAQAGGCTRRPATAESSDAVEVNRGEAGGREPNAIDAVATRSQNAAGVEPGWVGVIVASRSVDVRGEFGGRVTGLPAALGQTVRAGETLAELDCSAAYEDMKMRRAELRSARAAVGEAEVDAQGARREQDRVRRLHAGGYASRADLDDAELALARAEATRARAQAARNQVQAAVERSGREQAERTIVAPFDGVVARRHVDVGDTIAVGEPVVRVLEASVPTVAFAIPEGTAPPVAGTPVTVATTDGSTTWAATVVSAQPDADPRTGLIAVHATLTCPQAHRCAHATAVVVRTMRSPAPPPTEPDSNSLSGMPVPR